MRRFTSAVLLLSFLVGSPILAYAREPREPRDGDLSRIERVLRSIVRLFHPQPMGDYLSPPKP